MACDKELNVKSMARHERDMHNIHQAWGPPRKEEAGLQDREMEIEGGRMQSGTEKPRQEG